MPSKAGGAQKRKLRSSDAVSGEEEEVKGIKVKEVEVEEEVKKVKDVKDVNKVKEEAGPSCWLFKSEPDPRMEGGVDVSFSFEALRREPAGTACWDGVRNYSARNHMRAMKVGQKAFFYHSNTKPPGIIGLVEVVREAYTDHTQFDSKDPHYDSKSKEEEPKWSMVDVKCTRPGAGPSPASPCSPRPGSPCSPSPARSGTSSWPWRTRRPDRHLCPEPGAFRPTVLPPFGCA